MRTDTQDKPEKILNTEDQNEPVNPQDEESDATITAEDKKKGFSEGNRNDSDTTTNESIGDKDNNSKDRKTS